MKKSECRFRALVFVYAIRMQTIATTPSGRVINGKVQVIATQEPLEGASRFIAPTFIAGDAVRLEAGRDHRLCFDWLLIETCTFTALPIKPIRSDRDEMSAFSMCALQIGKPREGFESSLCHCVIRHRFAG